MLQEFAGYADFVNPNKAFVSRELTDRIQSLGMSTMSWTVRSRSDVQPLLGAGVDGIITDYPDFVPKKR